MCTAIEPTIASSPSSTPRCPVMIHTRRPTPVSTASVTTTGHHRGVGVTVVSSTSAIPAATLVEMLLCRTIESPVGRLTIAGVGGVVHHLRMDAQSYPPKDQASWRADDSAFDDIVEQLDAYFAG